MIDPLSAVCPECKSSAGDPCRDRYARAKPTCAARGNAAVLANANAQPKRHARQVAERIQPDPVATEVAAAHVRATEPEAFTEDTPPPRTRPIGVPVPRYLELPPGEDVVEQFRGWDRDGRIPPGSVLCRYAGGYTVEAAAAGAARPQDLDGFQVHVCIVAKPRTATGWVVMIPTANRRKS